MDIVKPAAAGTLESCDAAVTIEPRAAGAAPDLEIIVESPDGRFTAKIRAAAAQALAELGITRARLLIRDRSALDCTIRARVLTAALRGAGGAEAPSPAWEKLR